MVVRRISKKRNPYATNPVGGAGFTIGTEATNAITVTVQLRNQSGGNLAVPAVVQAYLSGVATGLDIVGTAPSGGVAIGASGKILVADVTGKMWTLVSTAAGLISLVLTEAAAATFYLVIVNPDGTLTISNAITFA